MAIGGVVDPNADIAALETAADGCLDTALSCLSTDDLSDRLVALATISAKVDAVRVATVRAAELANVAQLTDQRNVANHVAALTNTDPAAIRADQRIARWLADLPVLAEAYRQGRIHTQHLDVLRLVDNPRVHDQVIRDQHRFVRWFTTCHFRDISLVIERWLLGADPDGAEPKEHIVRTGVTITPLPGGMAKLTGLLDPLQAAAVRSAINAETSALRQKETDTGTKSTVRRRTLHALLNLISRGAARPDGSHARPRVNIVLSQKVYEKTLSWLADPASNSFPELDASDIDKKCQLIDGTPIHPLYALAATVTGVFRRLVYSARGRPIGVSVDSRRIPDWMRDVTLVTTNGKCANPVCDAPFEWLHADHITPYSHNHQTLLDDTRPLCEADNLWRGNDTTRGIWASPHDLPEIDDYMLDDPDDEDDAELEATIAHETQLARTRIRKLIAAG